ncbi:uncharacterized protein MYCFIDRAFT_207590 [Pseudocercospora fijiensis CIRAD86]|uniref:Uncharacterized protein n=1 Tax=Pseudocercospora fijiensis (strain CIRAD86) TaxID=383855 RepID=M3AZZ2_PSEFD|nr:uncharacterized protein MYCFIDRAFT_207590 [Pseudocercospora fijiensis CIRAD86]EME82728.1 hypothetical protein MYCFIDRAFT_207590 [Pseudocercospora fijiensis CIRAD86]
MANSLLDQAAWTILVYLARCFFWTVVEKLQSKLMSMRGSHESWNCRCWSRSAEAGKRDRGYSMVALSSCTGVLNEPISLSLTSE